MNEQQQLQFFLEKIQLRQFYNDVINVLHITRIEHFDHVVEQDLQSIGMSMPEIRRLFDQLKKNKKNLFFEKLKKSFRLANDNDGKQPKVNVVYKQVKNQEARKRETRQQDAKCLIQEKNISFLDILGKGAFGYVRSAEWTTTSGEKVLVAVKCIRSTGGNGVSDVQSEVIKEANAMSILNHPNLIRFYGIMIASPLMLVTELAPLGALLRRLRQEPQKFLISTLSGFLIQIVAGMKYLEKNNIIHRDLAARNILLMSYEKVKIGDFGLARPLSDTEEHYVMKPDGLIPFAWCAPECLKFKKFSHASDVWAFGVTAYELFTFGGEPWAGLNGAQIFDRIEEPNCERLPCPDKCPIRIYEILFKDCWKYRENDRVTFEVLEKKLLEALPCEITACNDNASSVATKNDNQLLFCTGDVITLFNEKSDISKWRCQNRRTGCVGFLPSCWINFSTHTLKAQFDEADSKITTRYCDEETENMSVEHPRGFTNKLCGNSGAAEKETLKDGARLSVDGPVFQKTNYECDSFSSSGYVSTSEKGSYRDDCLSWNSVDSGCICRCSTYSSDSSQPPYSTGDVSAPSSKPISIPGAIDQRRNRNGSGSFSKRLSTGSTHSYAIISDTVSVNCNGSVQRKRCPSCNSTQTYYILERENSTTSPSTTADYSTSMSPVPSPSTSSGMDRLKKAFSTLRLDSNKKHVLGSNTPTKNSPLNSMGERRRSLPDLVNPRKNDIFRRTRRSFRAMRRNTTMNENRRRNRSIERSAPTTGSRFYLQTKESLISSPVFIDNNAQMATSLYDLVPARDEKENRNRVLNKTLSLENDFDTHLYMTPISMPSPDNNDDHYKQPISLPDNKNDLYENISSITDSPTAPPRRRRLDPKQRFSMIDLRSSVDFTINNSPKTKQCIILD